MSSACKYLSFKEIVHGRDASVRITDDGLLFVVDLVMVMTGKSRDDSSRVLRDLPEEMFQQVRITCKSFPGKGNGRTKLVTFQDALELIMVMPGKFAKESRVQLRIRSGIARSSRTLSGGTLGPRRGRDFARPGSLAGSS
jgi:hypothetical protein